MLSSTKLAQFKSVLKDYSPSNQAVELLKKLDFVVLLGPSASGKNTIIRDMVKSGQYYYVISDTTREKRINNGVSEVDGVEYWFRNSDDFLNDLKAGRYLEAELIHNQQVSGINLSELKKAESLNKTALADLDIGGVKKVLALNPKARIYLILPPSFKVWLRRLIDRNNIVDSEIRRRLTTAIKILESVSDLENVRVVLNNNYKKASETIRLNIEQSEEIPQAAVNKTLAKLIEETKNYLGTVK